MNQEVKQKWVAALRSGEFQQTKEVLKNTQGYCCLGVLTELYRREHPDLCDWVIVGTPHHGECYVCRPNSNSYGGSPFVLTPEVIDWAGLPDGQDNPTVIYKERSYLLSEMNDGYEREKHLPISFKQIAATIEEQL
jgi:hypothetical protein